ncbi:MAG: DUF6261 family protein [Paludibacteraceae bacterium]
MEQHTPKVLNIEALFAIFRKLYADMDEAMEIIRKSASTEQITDADIARDETFRGFADAVKSAAKHFNTEKKAAAKRLQIIFDHYGNIARKPYDEETASIYNFLQEINAQKADVTLLGLTDWATQLETENNTFDTLMKARYDETTSKTTLKMKQVRAETDRCYRDILDRLDALIIVNGETTYAPFVKDLAARVERFDNLLAQRKGVANKNNTQPANT